MDSVTRGDLLQGQAEIGLTAGDVVMAHSSLSSFGHVEGGAETVIDALQTVLTQEGTLMMPSFGDFQGGEYGKVLDSAVIFDIRSSPSKMGKVTDVFWRCSGVRRSLSPTHSTAAWGKLRDEMVADHDKCLWSCGWGTPLHKLVRVKGRILLLGAQHTSNTFIHTIEDTGPAPTTTTVLFEPKIIDYGGEIVTVPTHPHLPGLKRRFQIADEFCRERGLQREKEIGSATVKLVDAVGFYQAAQEELAENPLYFIDADYYRVRMW